MRRLTLPALLLLAALPLQAQASRNDKDTDINTRYVETEAERIGRGFQETELPLPEFPDLQSGNWFTVHVDNNYSKTPKILMESITLAPDGTIRYILNNQSKQGHDNLSAEALFCSSKTSLFDSKQRSSYKVYGYGDTVNKRWIPSHKAEWKPIGAILNSADPLRGVLYRAFCEDGTPGSIEKIHERLHERAGRRAPGIRTGK